MTPQKVREALVQYEEELRANGFKPLRSDGKLRCDIRNDADCLAQHVLWMCIEAQTFPDEKVEKMMRWLGFIQGCMYCLDYYTINELKEHNRPNAAHGEP